MCTKVTLLCLGVALVRVRACLGFCSSAKGSFSLGLLQLKDKFLVAEGASTWATHGRRVEDCRFLFGSELKEMSIIFPNNSVMYTGTDGLGDYTWKHTRSGTEGPVPRWDKPVRCVWSRCTGMWRMTEPITTDPFFLGRGGSMASGSWRWPPTVVPGPRPRWQVGSPLGTFSLDAEFRQAFDEAGLKCFDVAASARQKCIRRLFG